MKFSIRDLMFFTALVALAVACLVNQGNLATTIEDQENAVERDEIKADTQIVQEQFARKQLEALKQNNKAAARRSKYFQDDHLEIGKERL